MIEDLEYRSLEPQLKKNTKSRNRYATNNKFRQKQYKRKEGYDCNPWKRFETHDSLILKRSARKWAERWVRRQPVGQETFLLKGCGYHRVYEWKWEV